MIRTLGEAAVRFGWNIHAYAMMDNHDQLLLETPEANLVSEVSWFQTAFTVRGNRQSGQCGHVSAGRYKNVLVQSTRDPYLSQLITYIHLNPARAAIFPELDGDFLHAHRWTSLYWLGNAPHGTQQSVLSNRLAGKV